MEIHSPLVVAERANHSFDPFPDEGRILPFGSGAAIFYNYIDLVLHNPAQGSVQRCGAPVSTKGQDSVVLHSERLYQNDVVVKYDVEEQQVE